MQHLTPEQQQAKRLKEIQAKIWAVQVGEEMTAELSLQDLKTWIRSQKLQTTDMVSKNGSEWAPAGMVEELHPYFNLVIRTREKEQQASVALAAQCTAHPAVAGEFRCVFCREVYCLECAFPDPAARPADLSDIMDIGCKKCGGHAPRLAKPEKIVSLWGDPITVLGFPLRKGGWITSMVLSGVAMVLPLAMAAGPAAVFFLPGVLIFGILFLAYFYRVFQAGRSGRSEMPVMSLTTLGDDILIGLQMLCVILVAYFPVLLLSISLFNYITSNIMNFWRMAMPQGPPSQALIIESLDDPFGFPPSVYAQGNGEDYEDEEFDPEDYGFDDEDEDTFGKESFGGTEYQDPQPDSYYTPYSEPGIPYIPRYYNEYPRPPPMPSFRLPTPSRSAEPPSELAPWIILVLTILIGIFMIFGTLYYPVCMMVYGAGGSCFGGANLGLMFQVVGKIWKDYLLFLVVYIGTSIALVIAQFTLNMMAVFLGSAFMLGPLLISAFLGFCYVLSYFYCLGRIVAQNPGIFEM